MERNGLVEAQGLVRDPVDQGHQDENLSRVFLKDRLEKERPLLVVGREGKNQPKLNNHKLPTCF